MFCGPRAADSPWSSRDEQDAVLAAWGAALAPLARERTPIIKVTWQEWAHALGAHEHRAFLAETGVTENGSELTEDYRRSWATRAPPRCATRC